MEKNQWGFETQSIRLQSEQTPQREHSVPLYLTSSFTFESPEQGAALFSGEEQGNLYSRFSNPNTDEFAAKLTALEGAEAGIATASGMSAIFTTLAGLLQAGDHLIASRQLFANTTYIIRDILPKWGITYTLLDGLDAASLAAALRPETKLLFIETPTNPTLELFDLAALAQVCRAHEVIFAVDNCFATPYLQQPIRFGADLVIHSATKWIDGQGRVLGGAVVGRADLVEKCYGFLRRTGPTLSAFNAWVLSKSLETLAVRMDRHCDNALAFARAMEAHPDVERVIYPGLESHPHYELAQKQMKKGGGMVSLVLKGGYAAGKEVLERLTIFSLTANLGDTRSIATHPASTTHSSVPREERLKAGIDDGLLRFSIGLETVDDLIADVENALKG